MLTSSRTTSHGSFVAFVFTASFCTWSQHTMTAEVPAAAKEARLAIVFEQPAKQPGAIWVDYIQFGTIDSSKPKNWTIV
jgi:hypothetical protein